MATDNGTEAGVFLEWLRGWTAGLETASVAEIVGEAGGPQGVAVLCVDLTNGFAHEGPLSSPRVKGIVQPVAELFRRAYAAGVRDFILPQDAHPADSQEFDSWPPHAIAGTSEAVTVPELAALPFSSLFRVLPKNSIRSDIGTTLNHELAAADLRTAIVVGDCTDLCVYQLAMHVRLLANAAGRQMRVIVPADCVQTYDLPVHAAGEIGALPHPGDLMHDVFLYHMALNGVRVVRAIGD